MQQGAEAQVQAKASANVSQLLRDALNTSREFPINSREVYQYQGRGKLWFGRESPPDVLEQMWRKPDGIKQRLDVDLQPTRDEIKRKGSQQKKNWAEGNVNAELRMSGYATSSRAESVTLCPCVWIFCGSKWALKIVQKAIRNLPWVESFLGRSVGLCTGGPQLCSRPTLIPLEELRLHAVSKDSLPYRGGKILYHIAKLDPSLSSPSVCGWLCCTTRSWATNLAIMLTG